MNAMTLTLSAVGLLAAAGATRRRARRAQGSRNEDRYVWQVDVTGSWEPTSAYIPYENTFEIETDEDDEEEVKFRARRLALDEEWEGSAEDLVRVNARNLQFDLELINRPKRRSLRGFR